MVIRNCSDGAELVVLNPAMANGPDVPPTLESSVLLRDYVRGSDVDSLLLIGINSDLDAAGTIDQKHYVVQDRQGSVVALFDEDADLVEAYEYSAYGAPTVIKPGVDGVITFSGDDVYQVEGSSSYGNPFMYTGREWESTLGLYHYRARFMDPELGRFISVDPIGMWGDAANLGNGYAYVGNSPQNGVDPTGEKSFWRKAKDFVKEGHRVDLSVCAIICVGAEIGLSARGPSVGISGGVGLGVQVEHSTGNTDSFSCNASAQASDWTSTHPEEASAGFSLDAENEGFGDASAEAGRNEDKNVIGTGGVKAEASCQVSPLDPAIDAVVAIVEHYD